MSEWQLQQILDTIPAMVSYVDCDYRYVYVNRCYEENFGMPVDQIVGKRVAEVIGEEAFARALPGYRRAMKGWQVSFENVAAFHDGSEHYLQVKFVPDLDADGKPRGFFSVAVDLTERRLIEREIKQLSIEIERLTRRQIAQQTVAAVAHDINQPLHAAATFVEAARRMLAQSLPGDAIARTLSQVAGEVARAGGVLRQLMDFLDDPDELRSATARVDLNHVAFRALEVFQAERLPERACVRIELASLPLAVAADEVAVEKVILNLLRNACEALDCRRQCAGPSIRLTTALAGSDAVLSVEDNGPGVSVAMRPHLFKAFRSEKRRGLGMGLAVSRRLVDLYGGRIWHEDRASGNAFCFSFPLLR